MKVVHFGLALGSNEESTGRKEDFLHTKEEEEEEKKRKLKPKKIISELSL